MEYNITLPFDDDTIAHVRIHDRLFLSGPLLVARDQAHQRLYTLLQEGKELPVSLDRETCYYMGPAKTPPGAVIGSCGPTTAARMDRFTPALMDAGLLATIGKGPRSKTVVEAIKKHKGLYLVAFGGCGALYATRVVSQETIAFSDLGPESIRRLIVQDFPVIVGIDSEGNSVFP